MEQEHGNNGMETAEKNRHTSYKKTNDLKQMIKIINEKLRDKKLTILLPSTETKYAKIISITEKGMTVQFIDFMPPTGPLVLSDFLNNFYTEVGIEVENRIENNLFQCKPKFFRIASQQRMDKRFPITDPESIYVNKIKISKTGLEVVGKDVPVSYKIVFDQFQQGGSHLAEKVHIGAFADAKDTIYNKVYRTGKTFYISDINEQESLQLTQDNTDFLKLEESGMTWAEFEEHMQAQGRRAWVISPILGNKLNGEWLPIGFIELASSDVIPIETVMEVKSLAFQILEKIKSMHLVEYKERHRVLDVSRGGLRVEVTNEKLIESALHRNEMIFDIVINKQAPITVQGWIRSTKMVDENTLHVGVKIHGENNRQNQMRRYYAFVQSLENEGG
jgi:hypothetical protein